MKSPEPESSSAHGLEGLLKDLVKALVRAPEKVEITHIERGPLLAFVIRTDKDDVRRVIGKQGKHFKALEVIFAEAARKLGKESHLTVDDKGPPPGVAPQKEQGPEFSARKFKAVTTLLKRVASLYIPESHLSVTATDIGPTTIFELKVPLQEYPLLHGKDAAFEYGVDGHLIGGIKNLFDGIAKNHGRIVRIVVNKT